MGVKENRINLYKTEIANYLETDKENITLFWKGRVALYGLLKSMGVSANDEVIIPAFTCVVVPNAIIYLGAKPIYVDIDEQTFNINVFEIEKKITANTKVIIAQNTFGLSCDINEIITLANKYNLKVIEDCTHGFGGFYKGMKNGTIADAAFFSSQWNKPFSTGIGGMAVVKNKEYVELMQSFESDCIQPSWKDNLMIKMLWFVKTYLLVPKIYWFAVKLFRWLSKKNVVTGSSEGTELESTKMPKNYLKKLGSFQAKKGVLAVKSISANIESRISLSHKYSNLLKQIGKNSAFVPTDRIHTFIKYPILVKDRAKFILLAEKNAIEIGDWFNSPLHPVQGSLELWCLNAKDFPNANRISRHIVNLPTHGQINEKYFNRIEKFLIENKEEIL